MEFFSQNCLVKTPSKFCPKRTNKPMFFSNPSANTFVLQRIKIRVFTVLATSKKYTFLTTYISKCMYPCLLQMRFRQSLQVDNFALAVLQWRVKRAKQSTCGTLSAKIDNKCVYGACFFVILRQNDRLCESGIFVLF